MKKPGLSADWNAALAAPPASISIPISFGQAPR